MKKLIAAFIIGIVLFLGQFSKDGVQNFIGPQQQEKSFDEYGVRAKQDLLCLWMAYPEEISSVEKDENNKIYVVMKSGKRILYDDKKVKTFNEQLANGDLQDMMEQIYPLGDIHELSELGYDPGRIRDYDFLKEVYGHSKEQVQSNLTVVKMGYRNLQFSKKNKADYYLNNVMKELVPLGEARNDIRICMYPPGGTFNYRYISGTGQLSPHSFGIAIDLAKDDRDYWQWASREAGEKRLQEYPREIVKIFEKNYFIWGGKWSHFDILHFEYRPELILKSMYFAKEVKPNQPWYQGVPMSDENIKGYIDIIDR